MMVVKKTILVVEDDEDIQQLVGYNLIKEGFNVEYADSGEQALEKVKAEEDTDLILLDIMLPGIDGMSVCKNLRSDNRTAEIPVIMLTAKSEDADVITGLDLGADDYITKPFSPKVLISRVKAVLRRKAKEAQQPVLSTDVITLHNLIIDTCKHEVVVDGEPVSLTLTEFNILELLAKKPGWVFSRQQIIDVVRGYDYLLSPRSMDVQVFGLRKKLGETGKKIETVRGIGYRMSDE